MNKGLGTEKSIWILEDDEDDFFLTKKALVDAGFNGEVHWFKDTKIIGDGLKTDFQKLQTELTTPYFILVDLNMPGISGFDFLDRSKENPYLKLTPKIILSTSDDNQDVLKALGKGANSYIVKPRTYSELKKKINNTLSYFLYTAEQTDWEGKT